jgi:hypothetical protein
VGVSVEIAVPTIAEIEACGYTRFVGAWIGGGINLVLEPPQPTTKLVRIVTAIHAMHRARQ